MRLFSVLALCLCTGYCRAQETTSAAPVNATATTAAPTAAPGDGNVVLNAPLPHTDYPHEESSNPRERPLGYYVPHCYDCPKDKECNYVADKKYFCYIAGNPVCNVHPDSGCEGKSYYIRWYYDRKTRQCLRFYFSNSKYCGGNKNNFHSLKECERICVRGQPDYYYDQGYYHGNYEQYHLRRPFPGRRPTNGNRPFPGRRPTNGNRPFPGRRPTNGNRPFPGRRPNNGDRSFPGRRPTNGDSPFPGRRPPNGDRPFPDRRPINGDRPFHGGRPINGDRPIPGRRPTNGGRFMGDGPIPGGRPTNGGRSFTIYGDHPFHK